jgi:hypothetical protein
MEDIYSSSFSPEQTVELQSMFRRCGFSGAEWVDIPAWLVFTVQVPFANGGLLANQKQSVGSAQGADFYLRRIQNLGLFTPGGGPAVFVQIKLPTGRYLQGGNLGGSVSAGPQAGVLTPGPLGLVKPEVRCPAGTNFTIDLLNVTGTYGTQGNAVATLIFEGVYRYRLEASCQ